MKRLPRASTRWLGQSLGDAPADHVAATVTVGWALPTKFVEWAPPITRRKVGSAHPTCLLLAFTVIALWSIASSALAQTGANMTTKGNGLSLTLTTQWLDGGGYRPVGIEIVPATVPVADRTVHVEFTGKSWAFRSREILASQDIEIPAGSTRVEATVSVPQHFPWLQSQLEVWVDGRYSRSLSQRAGGMGGNWNGWQEGLPNVLWVADASTASGGTIVPAGIIAPDPDSGELAKLLPDNANLQGAYGGVGSAKVSGTSAVPLYTLMSVPLDLLPQNWIDYTSLDLVCISLDQIEQMAAKHPRRWQALHDWTAAGGNLIVSGAGGGFENLASLDQRLDGIPKGRGVPRAGEAGSEATLKNDWLKPSPADYLGHLKDVPGQPNAAATYSSLPMIPSPAPGMAGQPAAQGSAPVPAAPTTPPDPPPFLLRQHGLGMVLASSLDDVFKPPAQYWHWAWMLNSLGADRWQWYRRHGLSYERGNPSFWDWMIEGVGLAPVNEFRILISLFVLAIGPVNYFWLRRRGKLHLLVLIVPLAALAVTSSLFGYAIVADGLDVRVRSRSFTQIDQRAGRAVCWARNTYYAGLAPSQLVFPADVAVFPLTINEGDTSDAPFRHSLLWTDGEQRLVGGWLASRTPTQFVTVRSRPTSAGLKFVGRRTNYGPRIENQLGIRIVRLLLADAEGKHYRAADVAAGARVELAEVEPGKEETDIWQLATERRSGAPQGFMPQMDYGFGGRRRGAWYSSQNTNLPVPTQESSRLEAALRTALEGSSGRSLQLKPLAFQLPPRSYLAIVERSPEVVFGLDGPREENSVHVIVGSW